MVKFTYPHFPSQHGYMTKDAQRAYIKSAVSNGILPADAQRMAQIVSLKAPNDPRTPIQFWQLHSVLGQDPIVQIVHDFYVRVFAQDAWFRDPFAAVGPVAHHINTQAAMWVDTMGGGPYYHGAEFRLHFHHTHNAITLMTDKGAALWTALMRDTLDANMNIMTDDPRVRISINTFLDHFMGNYMRDFSFEVPNIFGPTNPAYAQRVNFMRMTQDQIAALSEDEIRTALTELGVDTTVYRDKAALLQKALMI